MVTQTVMLTILTMLAMASVMVGRTTLPSAAGMVGTARNSKRSTQIAMLIFQDGSMMGIAMAAVITIVLSAVGTEETVFLTRYMAIFVLEQLHPPGMISHVPGANTNAWKKAPIARHTTTIFIATTVESSAAIRLRRTIEIGIAGLRSESIRSNSMFFSISISIYIQSTRTLSIYLHVPAHRPLV